MQAFMKALASYIMRSRNHFMLTVVLFTSLTLLLPLLGWVFTYLLAASIGLVTLRKGATEGLIGWLVCAGLLMLADWLSPSGQAVAALWLLGMAAMLIVACMILRHTRSLALSISSAGLIIAVCVVVLYMVLADSTVWWHTQLSAIASPMLVDADAQSVENIKRVIDEMAQQMTSMVAVALLLNTVIGLLLARWWQAILFNPGGFQAEYYELRFFKVLGVLTLVLAVLSMFDLGWPTQVARDLLTLVLAIYVFQGVSVAHALVAMKKLHTVWLVGTYVLVVVLFKLVALVGYVDSWVDFRRRLSGPGSVS